MEIFEATHAFSAMHKTDRIIVREGDTVESGHWLLSNYPGAFRPFKVTHTLPVKPKAAPKKAEPKTEKVEPKAAPEGAEPKTETASATGGAGS